MKKVKLENLLNTTYSNINSKHFIAQDPIYFPHKFTNKKDIEIVAFLSSFLAWGNRAITLIKLNDLLERLQNAPYLFITNHTLSDIKYILKGFKHRTINEEDIFDILTFFKWYFSQCDSLENIFLTSSTLEKGIIQFRKNFIEKINPSKKMLRHLPSPEKNSACKRLLLFLKWMVRKDTLKIDLGIWQNIKMSQLIIPLDVHVLRASEHLGLIDNRYYPSWKKAVHITEKLKDFCKEDPVKYDIALFTIGKNLSLN